MRLKSLATNGRIFFTRFECTVILFLGMASMCWDTVFFAPAVTCTHQPLALLAVFCYC